MACSDQDVKWLDGLQGQLQPVIVDGFSVPPTRRVQGTVQQASYFFLTHFHADHYTGLTHSWTGGPIYCTWVTGRLVERHLAVDPCHLRCIDFNVPVRVEEAGITFTFVDANHCPGAAMILFEDGPDSVWLHTGDFRASPELISGLQRRLGCRRLTRVWLDTTYALPQGKWRLPPQEASLDLVARICRAHDTPDTRFYIGGYTIGKERAAFAAAEALGERLNADGVRRQDTMFDCDFDETRNDPKGRVIFTDIRKISRAEDLLVLPLEPFKKAVVLHPTGWAVRRSQVPPTPAKGCITEVAVLRIEDARGWFSPSGHLQVYTVPYSEHSSYDELRHFMSAMCRHAQVTSTVGSTSQARAAALAAISGPRQASIREMFAAPVAKKKRRGARGVVGAEVEEVEVEVQVEVIDLDAVEVEGVAGGGGGAAVRVGDKKPPADNVLILS